MKANGNQLIGCTMQDQPFVYYNVLSGNGGNGLRITNSNDTTVQANFMGVGANNATVVANRGDGLLVSGSSKNTQVGGVIPLGNVISGNDQNGIEVRRHGQRIHVVQHLRRDLRLRGRGAEQAGRDPDHVQRRQQPDPHLHRLGQSRQRHRARRQRDRRAGDRHRGRDEQRRSRPPSPMAATAS